jgi:peptide/nickel transport system ATP-binding protein
MSALLEVEELQVSFGGRTAAVRGASFRVEKGETHCLVGESGCGKSVTALAVMSLLARGGQRIAKKMSFAGTDLTALSDREMARLRGNRMAMIFQEPMTSLNPAFTIGSQMAEVLTRHKGGSRAAALARAAELMGLVGITAPGMRLGQFPHQLSGGLRQRVMIAMALMCDPELLIADEPTTALDVTVQAQILRLLANLKRELGLSILLITHDLGIVARVADHVSVMYAGEVVERATTAELFRAPQHPYTRAGAGPRAARPAPRLDPRRRAGDRSRLCRLRLPLALLPCRPDLCARNSAAAGRRCARLSLPARAGLGGAATRMTTAIEVENLRCEFRVHTGLMSAEKRVVAVDDVSFSVPAGSVLGIVGESGCGKSTLARLILGLLKPTAGTVLVDGKRLFDLDRKARARLIQPVFQDPFASLNPRRRIKDIVGLPLAAQGTFSRAEIERRVAGILERVGLSAAMGERMPSQLSGGQRQRAAIARALVLEPRIVICDEPTSALDVSVQAQILNLLADLRRDLGLTYLFISHNLAVVEHVASEVAVMYLGRFVERNETDALFHQPRHPYTKALLQSVLTPEPGKGVPDIGLGDVMPDPANIPPGCRFNPRCRVAIERCRHEAPTRMVRPPQGMVECHLA